MNSGAKTLSGTQDGTQRDYFRRVGNVSLIAYLILEVVFLTMLLVTGNSLSWDVGWVCWQPLSLFGWHGGGSAISSCRVHNLSSASC